MSAGATETSAPHVHCNQRHNPSDLTDPQKPNLPGINVAPCFQIKLNAATTSPARSSNEAVFQSPVAGIVELAG
jgi:hypothetical protein